MAWPIICDIEDVPVGHGPGLLIQWLLRLDRIQNL